MMVPDTQMLVVRPSVCTNMLRVLSFVTSAAAVSVVCDAPAAVVVNGCHWDCCDRHACVRVIDIVDMRLFATCSRAQTRL